MIRPHLGNRRSYVHRTNAIPNRLLHLDLPWSDNAEVAALSLINSLTDGSRKVPLQILHELTASSNSSSLSQGFKLFQKLILFLERIPIRGRSASCSRNIPNAAARLGDGVWRVL